MKFSTLLFIVFVMTTSCAQLPYHSIPDYPEDFTAGNVISRTIDGLGYRYYWATESLRPEDLTFKPTEDARDAMHTLEHIHGLSTMIVNAVLKKPNIRPSEENEMSFEQLRKKTLKNLEKASKTILGKSAAEVNEMNVIFQRGDNKSEYPFWHILNGPVADALWHTGQIVSFRRSSGNPLNPKVNVFSGHTKH